MWNSRSNRILEIVVIVTIGAIVSIVNTICLRDSLLKRIEEIAKNSERNIASGKVTDISTRRNSNAN